MPRRNAPLTRALPIVLLGLAAIAPLALLLPRAAARPARPARAVAVEPGQQLVVAVHLTASGADVVTACQNEPFGDEGETFGERLGAALGLVRVTTLTDPEDVCVSIVPDGPVTSPGRRNERVFSLDTSALHAFVNGERYAEAIIVACAPRLPLSARSPGGPDPAEANGCPHQGVAWSLERPFDLDVRFRATSAAIARGVLAALSFWIALGTLATIAGVFGAARLRLRSLRRRPWLAWIVTGAIAGVAAYGWSLVAYRSSLVHALQLAASIGDVGGTLVLAIPAIVAVAVVAAAALRVAAGIRRRDDAGDGEATIARPRDGEIPGFWPPVARVPRVSAWTYVPAASLVASYLLLALTPKGVEVRVEGMLAASVAYALAIPYFAGSLLPHVYHASRMPRVREDLVLGEIREMGGRAAEVWLTPFPPAAVPVGGAIVRAGNRAFVWEPLAERLGNEELAAAIALRAVRKRGWPAAFFGIVIAVGLLAVARQTTGAYVPPAVTVAAAAIVTALALREIFEGIRVRTAARSGPRAERHLYGLLEAARTSARLAAGGQLGGMEAEMPGVAEWIWTRSLKLATSVARTAGLPDGTAERIAERIVAAESALPPLQPSELTPDAVPADPTADIPAPAPPASKKRAPTKRSLAKKTAAKKTAAKKTVAKQKTSAKKASGSAATRRPTARSGRRSRP